MKYEQAVSVLKDVAYTNPDKGKLLYDLVIRNGARNILELGTGHGSGACYLAAAAEENGGTVLTVDRVGAIYTPSVDDLRAKLNLQNTLKLHREVSSYTWFLKKKIEEQTNADFVCEPIYDIVFIDGPKDWTNDGAAFFMSEKLLKPGGLMIFDDFSWSYRDDEATNKIKYDRGFVFEKMSEEEYAQPQIERVFRLLVMPHPDFGDFEIYDDHIGIARKKPNAQKKTLELKSRYTPKYIATSALKRLFKKKAA